MDGHFRSAAARHLPLPFRDQRHFLARPCEPGYLQLEAWVREHATKIDPASIEAHNEKFLNWRIREDLASERRARFHIADPNFGHGITLNDLDDWDLAHAQLVASKVGTA